MQLYEAACYFITFVFLFLLFRSNKSKQPGFLFGLFLVLIFSARFVLEFFKTPQAAYEAGNLITVGQWLSVPFVIVGIILVLLSGRKKIS